MCIREIILLIVRVMQSIINTPCTKSDNFLYGQANGVKSTSTVL